MSVEFIIFFCIILLGFVLTAQAEWLSQQRRASRDESRTSTNVQAEEVKSREVEEKREKRRKNNERRKQNEKIRREEKESEEKAREAEKKARESEEAKKQAILRQEKLEQQIRQEFELAEGKRNEESQLKIQRLTQQLEFQRIISAQTHANSEQARREAEQARREVSQLSQQLGQAYADNRKTVYIGGKSGYIVVLSNKRSLGEDIYRIGITKRDPPQDSVKQLNSAVPFHFFIHATIECEDVDGIKAKLYDCLKDKRYGSRNFFKASLDDIEAAVEKTAQETKLINRADIDFYEANSMEEYYEPYISSEYDLEEDS